MARKNNQNCGHLELAKQIHEILDWPNNRHGEPAFGYKVVKTIINSIAAALHRGEDVHVRGFGIFRVVIRTPRRTANSFITRDPLFSPVTINHQPRKVVIFIPSIQLQAMLNQSTPNHKEARTVAKWQYS